jgi:hypothetical protein
MCRNAVELKLWYIYMHIMAHWLKNTAIIADISGG